MNVWNLLICLQSTNFDLLYLFFVVERKKELKRVIFKRFFKITILGFSIGSRADKKFSQSLLTTIYISEIN